MKSKLIFSILIAVISAFIVSCTAENPSDFSTRNQNSVKITENHISMNQARSRLNMLLYKSIIKPKASTLTANFITDSKAYNEKGEILTRAEEKDAMYYVFYIGNEGSYAIMSATDQLPELIAFSERGKSNKATDEAESKFMSYLSSLPDSLIVVNPNPDDFIVEADSLAYKFYNDQTTYELLNDVRPMDISWGDGYPFVRPFDVPSQPLERGIPAVTTAMYLTHPNIRPSIEKPSDYMADAGDIDPFYAWEAMYEIKNASDSVYEIAPTYAKHNIGILLRHTWRLLGNPNDYDQWSQGIFYDELLPRLSSTMENALGIQGGVCEEFDVNKAVTEIGHGYPIMIINYGPSDGNMWLSDAVLVQRTPYVVYNPRTLQIIDRGTRIMYLFHCNWGEYGRHNGYYPPDLMSTKTGGVDENGNPLNTKLRLTPPEETIFWVTTHMFYRGRPIK